MICCSVLSTVSSTVFHCAGLIARYPNAGLESCFQSAACHVTMSPPRSTPKSPLHKLYFCFVNSNNNLRSKEEGLVDRRLYPTLFCLCQPILSQSDFGFSSNAAAIAADAVATVTRRYLHIYVEVQRHLVHWSGSMMCLCLLKCLMPNPKLTCYSS